jgi:exopolyphosphatase/pppGpp-phosphohydrolase
MASEWIVCRQHVGAPKFVQEVWINLSNVNRMIVGEDETRLAFAGVSTTIPVKETPREIMDLLNEARRSATQGEDLV